MTDPTTALEPLVLQEWGETMVDIDLRTAQALASLPGMGITVAPKSGGWLVRPSSIVGVTEANGRQVLIRPKIAMTNLLNLLEVTPKSLKWDNQPFGYDTEPNVIIALIRLFRRGLDQALAQGLRHDYVQRHERQAALRGRIDMAALTRRPGLPAPIPCQFDDYTADIELNRLLLAATETSLRTRGVPNDDRMQLRRHRQRFEDVQSTVQAPQWVDTWQPNRLEAHYELAVRSAALLMRDRSPADRVGSKGIGRFTVNMNDLVEKFITRRLVGHLPQPLRVKDQQSLRFDVDGAFTVYPDLVVYRDEKPRFVIDVKYKAVEAIKDTSNSDLFQLHTYAQLLGLRRGAIISCSATDHPQGQPQQMTVRNSGVKLHLWPIDLRGTPEDINDQIELLIQKIETETLG